MVRPFWVLASKVILVVPVAVRDADGDVVQADQAAGEEVAVAELLDEEVVRPQIVGAVAGQLPVSPGS